MIAKKATKLAPDDMDTTNVLAMTYTLDDVPTKAKLVTGDIMKHYPRYSALTSSVLGLPNFCKDKLIVQ